MKRYGYLYEKIIDVDNCKKAILEATKRKQKRTFVLNVLNNIDYYAEDLSFRLKNLNFTTPYRLKEIEDGLSHKKRIIQIPKFYPDQCAHHAVVRVLQPIILKSSFKWSCANIKNRGIDYGSKHLTKKLRLEKYKYCLKFDIKKFYPSVPNDKLKESFRKKIKDEKALAIMDKIIDSNKGLPIGNYTSPWFAEFYLQPLDHYIKEVLEVPCLVRYADDCALLSNNKKKLHNDLIKINEFVNNELNLELKSNYQLFPIKSRKIDFMGKCYSNNYVTIRKRRALALMRNSRMVHKLIEKKLPISFHLASGFISRISIFKTTNSYNMKVKYQYSIDLRKLKDIIRKANKNGKN